VSNGRDLLESRVCGGVVEFARLLIRSRISHNSRLIESLSSVSMHAMINACARARDTVSAKSQIDLSLVSDEIS